MSKKSRQAKQATGRPMDESGASEGADIPTLLPVTITRKGYRSQLAELQVQMMKLQEWIVGEHLRAVVILEGLGPAGKGSLAKQIEGGLHEKTCRVVTLKRDGKRVRRQWHFQRYVEQFPPAGNMVILDGSWYHVPAMERALGVCDQTEFDEYLRMCADFECTVSLSGVRLLKYWFAADDDRQEERFQAHIADLLKRKDLHLPEALYERVTVSQVQEAIMKATHSEIAPWTVIDATDKRQAHLDCLTHLLTLVPVAEAV